MNRLFIVSLLATVFVNTISAQPSHIVGRSPVKLVEDMWCYGTRGGFLNPTDREWGSREYFSKPSSPLAKGSIRVVSNIWGASEENITGNTATVLVSYVAAGEIDASLRYRPPTPSQSDVTLELYSLVTVPAYVNMYATDGKTLLSQKPTGVIFWQIDRTPDPPWTTVNTAIRYVLEKRAKTNDPIIRKNADEAIRKLLQID